MRIAIFCHSLIADWNNGNAHFLRGIAAELVARGHQVTSYEPYNSWSMVNLLADVGPSAYDRFHSAYPMLRTCRYVPGHIDLEAELRKADLVLVHEWNDQTLVNDIALLHKRLPFIAFYHDTHHRAVTAPTELHSLANALDEFDAVLAFGEVLAQVYRRHRIAKRACVWHEAADIRIFFPGSYAGTRDDLVWIGNWGDEERTSELREYLLQPTRCLRLKASAFGVRYPEYAVTLLNEAGIDYKGWLSNSDVPETFGRFKLTLHIPRRPYAQLLHGIPTIRVFEALACGIPLLCAPWEDSEHLFRPDDFIIARNADEMTAKIDHLLRYPEVASAMASRGRSTVLAHHTCTHRVSELITLYRSVLEKAPI